MAETRVGQVSNIRRVADMLGSAHANLRDRYQRRAVVLDVFLLVISAWTVSLAFVDPEIAKSLTPFGLESVLWIGLLAVGTFAMTLVQMKVDWKGRSDAHKRAFEIYIDVKREAGYILADGDTVGDKEFDRLTSKYDTASAVGIGIPEKEFLAQKRHHLMKVEISKYLDKYPGALPWLLRLKWAWRDNAFRKKPDPEQPKLSQ